LTRYFNRRDQRDQRRGLRRNSTPAEQKLWRYLRAGQLGTKFRRQYSVDVYVIDFYAPQWKLAIEVDGGFHFSDEAEDHDRERTVYLKSFGITVLRFTNRDVLDNVDAVVQRIEQMAPSRQITSP